MFLTLRRYPNAGSRAEEIARRVQDGLVPILKGTSGFKGYCALRSEDDAAVSVSLFESRDAALEANARARQFVQSSLKDLLPNAPEVFVGECLMNEMPDGSEGQPVHIVVRQYDGVRAKGQQLQDWARRNALPIITKAPGFRGFHLATAEGDDSKLASVSMFDSRDNAQRCHEQVVKTVREVGRDLFPNAPRVTAGQTLVHASADDTLARMGEVNRIFEEEVCQRRNFDALAKVYTDDASILPAGGDPINGLENIKRFWADACKSLKITSCRLDPFEVEVLGDTAYEVARGEVGTEDGAVAIKYVVVWKRRGGQWKWHRDIWNMNA